MKVDKTNWKKVRLGDVCLPKTTINWKEEKCTLSYIDLTSVSVENHTIGDVSIIGASSAPSRAKQIVREGDVLFGTTRPLQKRCCLIPNQMNEQVCSTGFCVFRPNKDLVINRWAFYCFLSAPFYEYLSPLQKGVTYPAVSDKDVLNYTCALPSLPEQQAIAAELDALQSVIDKLQEQLKDYDNLAQSIFHEMFGDVVLNDRKWEKDTFSSLFTLKSGKGLSAKQQIEGPYNVYGGNGVTGTHSGYNKEGKHVIIGRVGAYCGNVRVVNEQFWLTDNAFDVIQKKLVYDYTFLSFALRCLNLGQYANKAAQPVISNVGLKEVVVPLPPFPFQQQFARRVEAIEAQKALVRQQIEDARQLMDSRMQYYFE